MNRRILTIPAAALTLLCVNAANLHAQGDDAPAITARVHGTFEDKARGAGVLSGDMAIVRFEVRNGMVTAIGRITGALADSTGAVLGQVDEDLALAVGGVDVTCNQLRLDLGATDADILGTRVHFDAETGGFDSRDGATPKALGILCVASGTLARPSAAADRARVLNDIVRFIARQR
jgi:hypothetical protein